MRELKENNRQIEEKENRNAPQWGFSIKKKTQLSHLAAPMLPMGSSYTCQELLGNMEKDSVECGNSNYRLHAHVG